MRQKFRISYLKIFLVISLSLLSKFSYSQIADDFIGEWKIINVELLPNAGQEEKDMLPVLKPMFLKSIFQFKSNNLFSFLSPIKDLSIKDGVWVFDMKNRYLRINERTSKVTGGQLMGIFVKEAEGRYLFQIEETPVILTVTKRI